MLLCGQLKITGLLLTFQVLINGLTTEMFNIKEPIMDYMLFHNMPYNGLINLKHVISIYFKIFNSNQNYMEKWILQELIRTNMSPFLIFGMKEEKFISIRSKKFSNIEWTNRLNLKNKNKQLKE